MARDHARMQLAIWDNDDFKALDVASQNAYWTLVTQRRLSYAGVLDYFPSRVATLASDNTEARVRAAVRRLEKTKFVVVDKSTHELLIRTYIKHDRVLERVNMGKACARAYGLVVSPTIRDAILLELGRLLAADPNLAGWVGFKEQDPMAFGIACDMASTMPLPMPSTMASGGE
jgi:hypothetical protein